MKNTKTKTTKLRLGAETLRELRATELQAIQGGAKPITAASNNDVCCA